MEQQKQPRQQQQQQQQQQSSRGQQERIGKASEIIALELEDLFDGQRTANVVGKTAVLRAVDLFCKDLADSKPGRSPSSSRHTLSLTASLDG